MAGVSSFPDELSKIFEPTLSPPLGDPDTPSRTRPYETPQPGSASDSDLQIAYQVAKGAIEGGLIGIAGLLRDSAIRKEEEENKQAVADLQEQYRYKQAEELGSRIKNAE
jgi:hypothetical protein